MRFGVQTIHAGPSELDKMNICHYCIKENGHTEFCTELQRKARNSNITQSIYHHCSRAVVRGYKVLYGEKDKNLIPMWEQSAQDRFDMIGALIQKAHKEGKLNHIYMPEA